jgi:cytochrome c-type biogenesis protein CcmH/NrfG
MKAVERDPNEVKSLYQLALLALQSGEDTQAIYYLQRLTFLTPRHAEVFMLLGKLYMQRGQLAAAALHLWEARNLQPDLPDVQHLLQQVYEALRQEQR